MIQRNKKTMMAGILIFMIISLPCVMGVSIPFACFADGEIFHPDGTPAETGVNVYIKNLATGEEVNTTTGYPNYPPVEQYDNDYKSVFVCTAGHDKVAVKAWNGTHYGYGEMIVPEDSQALLNITLDKKYDSSKKKGTFSMIKKLIWYFFGGKKVKK